MDDLIGGNYNQTEEQVKTKKMMKIIAIVLVVLFVISIALIGIMFYVQSTQLKIDIDGEAKKKLKDVLIIEDEKVYVPIRAFASYVGYESANGDYKEYSENTDQCYVKSENEVATFTLNSNKMYKVVLDGSNDYEYYELDEPVTLINNQLCTTIEGAQKAFNILMTYDAPKKKISIRTLKYLVTYYSARIKNSAISEKDVLFSNQKALLYNMIIVKNAENNYGVSDLKGNEILGTKYSKIKFIESTQEFIVTTLENKMGIMAHDSKTIISPDYDNIKQIDKDTGLYLVTNNGKQGVVNSKGSIIIYLDYDQIGVDSSVYKEVQNPYLLYGKCIPVKRGNKWGVFDKNGKQVADLVYDDLGCSAGNKVGGNGNANNVLLIPKYEGIVVKVGNYYGIITSEGNELVQTSLTSVYSITTAGESTYYMIFNGQIMNIVTTVDASISNTNNNNPNQNNEVSNEVVDGNQANTLNNTQTSNDIPADNQISNQEDQNINNNSAQVPEGQAQGEDVQQPNENPGQSTAPEQQENSEQQQNNMQIDEDISNIIKNNN